MLRKTEAHFLNSKLNFCNMKNIKVLALITILIVIVISIVFSIIYYRRGETNSVGLIALIGSLTVATLSPLVTGVYDNKINK